MLAESFQIWDASGKYPLLDENDQPIWLTATELRICSSRRQVKIDWSGSDRIKKVRLVAPENEVFPGRVLRRLVPAQPFCVRIRVGDHHHAYMHVAQRCRASYDGRSLYIGSDGQGNDVYASQSLSAAHL